MSTRSGSNTSRELQSDESARNERLNRIVAKAKIYLGNDDLAQRWLKRPNRALAGRTPVSMVNTEDEAQTVENVLGRIAYGGIS